MTYCIENSSFTNNLKEENVYENSSFSSELDNFERSFSEKLANLKKTAHSTCISHRSKSCTDAFFVTPKCNKLIDMTTFITDENTNPNTPASCIDTYVFRSPNKRIPFTDITKSSEIRSPMNKIIENQSLIDANNKLNEKVKRLEKENKLMKEKEKELNLIISKLNKEVENISKEKEKIEKMKSIDEFQYNQNILFYTSKIESYERLYSEKENEINKLSENKIDLVNKLSEMQENLDNLSHENREYKNESERIIEDLTFQNKSLESKCAALNQMYSDLKKDLSTRMTKISKSPKKRHIMKRNNYSTVYETIFDYSTNENCINHKQGSSLMHLDEVKLYIYNIIFLVFIFLTCYNI